MFTTEAAEGTEGGGSFQGGGDDSPQSLSRRSCSFREGVEPSLYRKSLCLSLWPLCSLWFKSPNPNPVLGRLLFFFLLIFKHQHWLLVLVDHFFRDAALFDARHERHFVHDVEHRVFYDRS